MFTKWVLPQLAFTMICSATLLSQQTPAAASPSTPTAAATDFPVIFQQKIEAGKTPVGTKIQAKLDMATLVNGTVIPRNAVLSGEVLESIAKTKAEPSRVSVRVDSAQWKNGTATLKLYLIPWYYPPVIDTAPNLQYGPQQSDKRTWNGMGQYPDASSPAYRPFPKAADSDQGSLAPNSSTSTGPRHRVRVKDVEAQRTNNGVITLLSTHSNIKLDKATTYVLAGNDLTATAK
jgi:hypothetical protein